MPNSPRISIPYPSANSNPWDALFSQMVLAIDTSLYTPREDRNIVMMGGGTMTFTASTGVLSWTSEIDLLASVSGLLWAIPAGSVTLADGQLFYIAVARAPQSATSYTPVVASFTPNSDNALLIGVRKGGVVHFRNGSVIVTGQSQNIFDTNGFAGGYVPPTGTGFVHITANAQDAVARAVNMASTGVGGDVTGTLAALFGGRLQGAVNVNHTTPGAFDATHQVAYCDTATGTCSVSFPLPTAFLGSFIPPDWQLLVVDTAGSAATSSITVNPSGETVWNPTTGTFGTGSVVLGGTSGTNGIAALWQWDLNKGHWVLVNSSTSSSGSGSGFGTIGNGGSVVTTTYTLLSTDYNTLIAAGAQVTGPATPTVGATYRLTSASGTFETNPARFLGNGYNVDDPNPINFYDNASNVPLKTSGAVYQWWWDGSRMRLAV